MGLFAHQSSQIIQENSGGKPTNNAKSHDLLVPLSVGIIVSSDKIAPKSKSTAIIRLIYYSKNGQVSSIENIPVLKTNSPFVLVERVIQDGFVQAEWINSYPRSGGYLTSIHPGNAADPKEELFEKPTFIFSIAEPVTSERNIIQINPVEKHLDLVVFQTKSSTQPESAVSIKKGQVVTKEKTGELTIRPSHTNPIKTPVNKDVEPAIKGQTLPQREIPFIPNPFNNLGFLPFIGRVFGGSSETVSEELPVDGDIPVVGFPKRYQVNNYPPPEDPCDEGYYYETTANRVRTKEEVVVMAAKGKEKEKEKETGTLFQKIRPPASLIL